MFDMRRLGTVMEEIDALRELTGDQEFEELIEVFLSYGADRVGALGLAIGRGDASGLADEAHALRGSSASLGVRELASLCAQLEVRGREGRIDGARPVYEELVSEFDRVTGYVAQARGGVGALAGAA